MQQLKTSFKNIYKNIITNIWLVVYKQNPKVEFIFFLILQFY